MTATHKITRIERARTSTNKPMWKCNTEDGDKVNIFQHTSLHLFRGAGYSDRLTAMQEGEIAIWETYPIAVEMRKSGEWWEIDGVDECPDDAVPDAPYVPNTRLFRQKAIAMARLIRSMSSCVYMDTETTGVTDRDEVVQFAAYCEDGLSYSVQMPPTNMIRYLTSQAAQVTGIIDFSSAVPFDVAAEFIHDALHLRPWVIYNAKFDTAMIDRQFTKADKLPPLSLGVFDAMKVFSEFYGEWDALHQCFASKKLGFAYEHLLGVPLDDAHDAMIDVMGTNAIIKAMAEMEAS